MNVQELMRVLERAIDAASSSAVGQRLVQVLARWQTEPAVFSSEPEAEANEKQRDASATLAVAVFSELCSQIQDTVHEALARELASESAGTDSADSEAVFALEQLVAALAASLKEAAEVAAYNEMAMHSDHHDVLDVFAHEDVQINSIASSSIQNKVSNAYTPLVELAAEHHKTFLESAQFSELYEPSSDASAAGDSIMEAMMQSVAEIPARPDLSSLYATNSSPAIEYSKRQATPSETLAASQIANSIFHASADPDTITSIVEETFRHTVFDSFSAFVPASEFMDAASEMSRVVALRPAKEDHDGLAEYVDWTRRTAGRAAINTKPTLLPPKRTPLFAGLSAAGSKPVRASVTEQQIMSRGLHELYEQQQQQTSAAEELELLVMEVEYFFDRQQVKERDETERRGETFLGAGGKILSGIAKAITSSGHPPRAIMREVAAPTAAPNSEAAAKPAQGSLDSISQAIVISTREAQWNSAKDGKIHTAPVAAAITAAGTAATVRQGGKLDAKLVEKPWVYEVYSEKVGKVGADEDGLNAVDVAVDDVIREGIQKLKPSQKFKAKL